MKISDNTVLITGGTSGIGFELAKQLIALGNTVIITGRDEKRLRGAQIKLPGLHVLVSDVGNAEAIATLHRQVIERFPGVNVIVNNAGVMKKINLHEERDFDVLAEEIDTNFSGTVRMVTQFLPHLKTKENAAIVNVSSGLAFVPLAISPVYCATKAAVHSYTLSLRVQLEKSDVRVFELAPPLTVTALVDSFDAADMEATKPVPVADLVRQVIRGLKDDRFEMRPGAANLLHWMGRIAPRFILKQLSKPVDRMLAQPKQLLGSQPLSVSR